MKRFKLAGFLSCVLTLLGSVPARAQFAVFDASNYAAAVQEFHQLQQTYTTALETRDEIIATYNLTFQMAQMPQDLAARYKADFSQWTNLSAPDIYGNTAAWVNALNIGSPMQASQAYANAVVQLESYPNSSYSTLDSISQATIQNQYATSELAQGMTIGTLATLGTVRSDSEAFSQQLANLDVDTFSTDPTQQTEMAVLGKINSATLLQVHSQQDANQILATSVEQQLIAQKQQIDAQNRTINQAIYFQQTFPTIMGNVTTGVSDAIHAISLSPVGR